jgi:putative PIN family toxin of toxin-antitoxin system
MSARNERRRMMNIILDTNIIISSALTPQGVISKLINFIIDNEQLQIYYSSKIISEYQKVLAYKKLNICQEIQVGIVNKIQTIGILIEPNVSVVHLPHEPDRIFYLPVGRQVTRRKQSTRF